MAPLHEERVPVTQQDDSRWREQPAPFDFDGMRAAGAGAGAESTNGPFDFEREPTRSARAA
jgi:hypothetical protein